MNFENRYFVKKLNELLVKRKERNATYSLRAFARDLKVPKSTLHEVLEGRRALPVKNLSYLFEITNLSPIEKTLFTESLYRTKVRLDEISIEEDSITQRHLVDDSHFKIVVEWEHYALLSLIETFDFKSNIAFIAKRLNIKTERARTVLSNLLTAGFVKKNGKEIIRCTHPLATTEDIPSQALIEAHKEVLELSKKKLTSIPTTARDYSTITISINSQKMNEAKSIIREFRKKITKLLAEGQRDEVYQIAIQMYPLTVLERGNIQ